MKLCAETKGYIQGRDDASSMYEARIAELEAALRELEGFVRVGVFSPTNIKVAKHIIARALQKSEKP